VEVLCDVVEVGCCFCFPVVVEVNFVKKRWYDAFPCPFQKLDLSAICLPFPIKVHCIKY